MAFGFFVSIVQIRYNKMHAIKKCDKYLNRQNTFKLIILDCIIHNGGIIYFCCLIAHSSIRKRRLNYKRVQYQKESGYQAESADCHKYHSLCDPFTDAIQNRSENAAGASR